MEEMQKKIGRSMGFKMGFTMSFILSLIGNLSSGHFSIVGWIISFVISVLISVFVLGTIFPMKKMSDGAAKVLKLTPGKIPARIVSSLISALIYTTVLTTLMITVAYHTQAKKQLQSEIDKTKAEITAVEKEIGETEAQITAMEQNGAPQEAISGLREKVDGLKNNKLNGELKHKLEGQEGAQKNQCKGMLLKGLAISYPVSFLVSFFIQPIYLKMTFKKYGIDM